jgi:uncharacterized protein (DUF983 family)
MCDFLLYPEGKCISCTKYHKGKGKTGEGISFFTLWIQGTIVKGGYIDVEQSWGFAKWKVKHMFSSLFEFHEITLRVRLLCPKLKPNKDTTLIVLPWIKVTVCLIAQGGFYSQGI